VIVGVAPDVRTLVHQQDPFVQPRREPLRQYGTGKSGAHNQIIEHVSDAFL
jgi:hypothetical protein